MSDAPLQLVALAMFAEINARLDAGEPRASVLTEKGLTEAEFHQEQQRWLNLLAAQAQEQQWQLQQRYSALYTQWRLKDNRYPTPSIPLSPVGETSRYASPTVAELTAGPFDPPIFPRHSSSHQRAASGVVPSYEHDSHSTGARAPALEAPAFLPDNPPPKAPAFLVDHSSPQSLGLSSSHVPFGGRDFHVTAEGSRASPPAVAPTPSPQDSPTSTFAGATLSFEQLTCLTAELDTSPAKAAPVLAGYGVDQSSYDAQHRALRARCEADSDLQQRYDRLLTYYRAVVSQR